MRVALYIRVSTGEQSPDLQARELRAWAGRLGAEIVAEYSELASGSRGDRAALNRLLGDAHRRRFDAVLVWALDRLSREGIARMLGYLERLKVAGVSVRSYQEPWLDTGSPVSDLLLAVFSWVAQHERERIRERVRAGLRAAKGRGVRIGRPRARVDTTRLRSLLASGVSRRRAAKALGVSEAPIRRALRGATKPSGSLAS